MTDTATVVEPADAGNRFETIARRIADRIRAEWLVWGRQSLDKPEFRQEGGTDEMLDLLAPLTRSTPRAIFSLGNAARAVGQEFGIPIPDDDPARATALERISSELKALVERVYELVMTDELTVADELLACALAAEAPTRMLADAAARVSESEIKIRHPLGRPASEQYILERASEWVALAKNGFWRLTLCRLLEERWSIPESARGVLSRHPALDRSMELLGKTSTATSEEIERWRPQIRVDAATDAAAQRIAASARQLALVEARNSIAESDPGLSPDERTARAASMVDDDPSWWGRTGIEMAARNVLGIHGIEFHPAVLRAEQLIPRLPSYYEVLIRDFAKSPQEAAVEVIAGAQKASQAPKLAPEPRGLDGEWKGLPSDPPPFKGITLRARHLGGHPALPIDNHRLWLLIVDGGASIYADPRCDRTLAIIEFGKLRGLRVDGPDTFVSRVTIPRIAAGGLLAFAKKKQTKLAYLVFEPNEGADVIFEVSNFTHWELEGALSPLLRWFADDWNKGIHSAAAS